MSEDAADDASADAVDQTIAHTAQTLADSDQASADSDQASAVRDQTSAGRDQLASDQDQLSSDRDLAAGGDPDVHEHSRLARLGTTQAREHTASARLQSAGERDRAARARDLAALARDQAAEARDRAMAQLDARDEDAGALRAMTGAEIVLRAAEERRRAAAHRARAAEHRALAAADREAAARDREQAARDRRQALADREMLARELMRRETDPLTGARARAAGLVELDHELTRCRRTNSTLVIAYVDVVGLKAINDTKGHAAGDELLARTIAVIKQHLRPYDLIVRVGGDEFLCAMSGMTRRDAQRRFSQIVTVLASARPPSSIRTGFADLTSEDTVTSLIARADHDLIEHREIPPR